MRALDRDRFVGSWVAIAGSAALICAWLMWGCLARVTVWEPSRSARVEVEATAHPLEVRVEGRVVVNRLELGREVEAGETLLEIDDRALRLQLKEETTRKDALLPQLDAQRAELAAAQRLLLESQTLGRAAADEVHARARSVEVMSGYAQESADRAQELAAKGAATADESKKASAQADRMRANLEASKHHERTTELDHRARASEQLAKIAGMKKDLLDLEGRVATEEKAIARIEQALLECVLRAPVSGRIAEVVDLPPGAVARPGVRVGAIVPLGELRIVAELSPGTALGRVKPGQRARMRLDSFPWLEHGMLEARVRSIASEAPHGTLRVELELEMPAPRTIKLQHGLLGSVEIDVEEVSPATLVLRAAGDLLRERRSATP